VLIIEKKHFTFMSYYMKLNGQSKCLSLIVNFVKTTIGNEDECGDPTVPTQEGLPRGEKVIRNKERGGSRRGRKSKRWRRPR
jgi:hypothetical protein